MKTSAANDLLGVVVMAALLPLLATTVTAWSDSSVHDTVLPTEYPTATSSDPWQCVTENLTQYFDVPKPTGDLLTALASYGDKLIEACTITGADRRYGCFPQKEAWCDFATTVAPELLPDYSSYGNAASSWWAAHSSKAVSLAEECPFGWYDAQFAIVGGPTWLNETIIFAACYGEETEAGGGSSGTTTTTDDGSTTTAAMPPLGGATETGGPTATATTGTSMNKNGVLGRAEDVGMWMVAGTGLAAAAVNSVL